MGGFTGGGIDRQGTQQSVGNTKSLNQQLNVTIVGDHTNS